MSRGVEDGEVQSAVQLCCSPSSVSEVLERTGIDRIFRSHPDRESALAAF